MELYYTLQKLVDEHGLSSVAATIESMIRQSFYCDECMFDCWTEYYMLHDDVWLSVAGEDEMLCIPCIEYRLKRVLDKKDFTEYPVNTDDRERTPLLQHRLTRDAGDELCPERNGYAWTVESIRNMNTTI